MRAEIISVGTELLLGDIVDTNAPYLSRQLSTLGIDVYYRVTVGDNTARLADALKEAIGRADIVITIGGLGPTEDDLTKETIAQVFGERMVADPASEKSIRDFFARRGAHIAESNLKQALKPETSIAIANSTGTAPGIILEKNGKIAVALPGPPGEFIPMLENSVIPYLSKKSGGAPAIILSRTLKVAGIGESAAEEKIKDLIHSKDPTIAPYAKSGEVHFRITAKAPDKDSALEKILGMEARARGILGRCVYGTDNDMLESVLVRMLEGRGLTLALAESCTGGLVSHRITNVPGSSKTLLAGIVAYANKAKTTLLGVPEGMIRKVGAVSPEVAEAMARGAAERTGADIAIGITGIAGPGGGNREKPVGLVYIGIKTPFGDLCTKNILGGNREDVKWRASQAALNQLRMHLIEHGKD